LAGQYVLNFFGVSIADVQLAGGLVLCALAWSLLMAPEGADSASRPAPGQVTPAVDWRPRAFYPLTMPLTVGPGSISVALTLGAHRANTFRDSLFGALADAVGMAVVAATVYVCYRYGTVILRTLGTTRAVVLSRLSAFLLLCIGVHIGWSGAQALLAHAFLTA
jgi:multiple antibiotic resistance protein